VSEHLNGAERQPRVDSELERMAGERRRDLERNAELTNERPEQTAESAREKIKHLEQMRPAAESASKAEGDQPPVLTKAANYRQTMTSLQHRMKPAARSFSRFIHKPLVDSTSELVGKTVLRPSVTLGATSTAVLATLFLYIYSRWYGITLRGSEVWLALLIGAVVGIVAEGVWKLLRSLSQR
jgi:membrane-bound ClpP family serine protease